MRKTEDSSYPPDWVKVAKKDWHRMEIMIVENDIEIAAYFLQQSLEKHIKAFLIERGWKLKKIHELDALLDIAVKYDPSLEIFRDLCERVSGYYFSERYPALIDTELTIEDLEKDIKQAKMFIEKLFGEKNEKNSFS